MKASILILLALCSSSLAADLKQSTSVTISYGPIITVADGTRKTSGLSIRAANVKISKAGAAFASKNDTTAPVEDSNGHWRITLNSTDTGTVGIFRVDVIDANAVMCPTQTYEIKTSEAYENDHTAGALVTLVRTAVAKLLGLIR